MPSEHTPGPWTVAHNSLYIRAQGDGGQVCSVSSNRTFETLMANAKFIAAAPETAAELDKLKELRTGLIKLLGHDLDVIEDERDSLKAINAELLEAGQTVVDVIGGGSGAMDRLRAAIRLHAVIDKVRP